MRRTQFIPKRREPVAPAAGIVIALALSFLIALALNACGPSQHPCVTAYEKARTPEEIEEVDKTCGHMLLPSASISAEAPQ